MFGGARFQAGPISEWLIQEAIDAALVSGKASILSINDVQGRKVMRIAGGLNRGLRNDFMYNLERMGVAEIDLSAVTAIDEAGLELCHLAVDHYKIEIVQPSIAMSAAMASN